MAPRHRYGNKQTDALYELSATVLKLVRSPPTPISLSGEDSLAAPPPASPSSPRRLLLPPPKITPAGIASLLLGVSLALMMCGSLTFFIGFMLMPWVFGLATVFYLAGIVSSLSVLGRSVFGSQLLGLIPGRRHIIPRYCEESRTDSTGTF